MILEAFKEASDAVEQVDKRVVARTKFLGRLVIDFTVTRENNRGSEGETDNKKEANTADDCQCGWESLIKWRSGNINPSDAN